MFCLIPLWECWSSGQQGWFSDGVFTDSAKLVFAWRYLLYCYSMIILCIC